RALAPGIRCENLPRSGWWRWRSSGGGAGRSWRRSPQLQGGQAGGGVRAGSDRRAGSATLVLDREGGLHVCREPQPREPVVLGPHGLVENDGAILVADHADGDVLVPELAAAGGEAVEVALVCLLQVGGHREVERVI